MVHVELAPHPQPKPPTRTTPPPVPNSLHASDLTEDRGSDDAISNSPDAQMAPLIMGVHTSQCAYLTPKQSQTPKTFP